MIQLKRIYEPYAPEDGDRVLVERLWPRGVSKAEAHLDAWERTIAPSDELRRWYHHDPARWEEFQRRYLDELRSPEAQGALNALAERARHGTVTLLYAARAGEISNAAVLACLIDGRAHGAPPPTPGESAEHPAPDD